MHPGFPSRKATLNINPTSDFFLHRPCCGVKRGTEFERGCVDGSHVPAGGVLGKGHQHAF